MGAQTRILKFIFLGILVSSSVSFAATPLPQAKKPVQNFRAHPHLPQQRPVANGVQVNQQRFVRNHVTAPLGFGAKSIPNEPGAVNNIIEGMRYATAPASSSSFYIHN